MIISRILYYSKKVINKILLAFYILLRQLINIEIHKPSFLRKLHQLRNLSVVMKMTSEVLWVTRKFRIPRDVNSLDEEDFLNYKTSVLFVPR